MHSEGRPVRWCPLRAWRERACGGLVDRLLISTVVGGIAYGVYRATIFVCTAQ
jgi:hypothetical protein